MKSGNSPRGRAPARGKLPPAVPASLTLSWFCWSDKGRVRANNEDSFLGLRFNHQALHRLGKTGEASLDGMDFTFAVSDGMGGAQAGEFASKIAVETITTLLPREFRRPRPAAEALMAGVQQELFRRIHRELAQLGQCYEECRGMETTMSLCWFTEGRLSFGHVGDSRIYHLPAAATPIRQITMDDTHVAWLLRQGRINEREARTHPRRNVLQKALGGENVFVDPQTGTVPLERGDQFLLCSDGLSEGLLPHQMVELLRAPASARTEHNPARILVEAAVQNDGRDNVTALVVRVG